MKAFFTLFVLLISLNAACAQNITADTARANALYTEAETLKRKSHYDSALLLYRQALPLYEKHKLWEKSLCAVNGEVRSLMMLSQLDSAEAMGEGYLKRLKKHLETESAQTAELWHTLGLVVFYKSHYAKSLKYYKKSLSIKVELLGEKHSSVANTYNNMAIVYSAQSRYEKALEYYQKSLDIDLNLLGEKHENVAGTYGNMAIVFHGQYQYEKALEYYQKSLNINIELFGEKNMLVANTYNNMAIIYTNQSRYGKALKCYQKSLRITQDLIGEEHPNVADNYSNIAGVYRELARYEKALTYYQKGLDIYLKALGKRNTDVAATYYNMAILHQRQTRYTKALEYYQKSLDIDLELLGEEHVEVALTYNNIGLLYKSIHKYDSAAFYHHKAVKACTLGFESNKLPKNPQPEQAIEKNSLVQYLQHKAEALTLLGQRKEALQTYAVAAECAKLAMQEADRENDKLGVAARAHAVHTQAALLHFLRGKRVKL